MDLNALLNDLKGCSCGKKHELEIKNVEISSGAINKTSEILNNLNMGKRLHIVGDKNTLNAAKGLEDVLKNSGFILSYTVFDDMHCSDIAICRQIMEESKAADSILAVGTGSINDLCRYTAFLSNKPYSVFATAPSMDGFVSCVSPLIENGFKRTYNAISPLAVIADSDILARSPHELKAAGFGDIIGKYTALADWRITHLITDEYFCSGICSLVESAVEKVCKIAPMLNNDDPKASEALMEALVLSGLAIQLCGSSRPASGAEHHLSHLWEMDFITKGKPAEFHGKKVGIAEVIISDIYKKAIESGEIKNRKINKINFIDKSTLQKVFGNLAEDIIKENTPNPLSILKEETLEKQWTEICKIINKIPDTKTIKNLLTQAGAAFNPKEAHIDDDLVEKGIKYSCYIRKRITFLRIINNII